MKNLILKMILNWIEGQITPEVIDKLKKQAIDYLRELAQKTDNELDDKIVEIIASALD